MSSYLSKDGLQRYHNGIKSLLGGKVAKRENGNYYNSVGSYYTGGTNPTYYRITLSDNALSIWNMQFIEVSMRQNYSTGKSGKILINGHNNGSNSWSQLNASVLGNLTNDIKVYGYGGKYIYIAGGLSWGGISIDTVLVGDGAVNKDITYSIDVVTSLPSGYVSATMLYYNVLSTHTHNYAGSSSAGGAATSANKVNSSITIQLNGGTTEETNKFTFNGSAAKSLNITPSSIGAASSSHDHDSSYATKTHNHDDRYYTETEVDTKLASKSPVGHTHNDYITSEYLGQNYYSKSQIDDGFSTSSHNHDSKYTKKPVFCEDRDVTPLSFESGQYLTEQEINENYLYDSTGELLSLIKNKTEIINISEDSGLGNGYATLIFCRNYNVNNDECWVYNYLSNDFISTISINYDGRTYSYYISNTSNYENFALKNHDHNGVYSPVSHNHDSKYATKTHTHSPSEISGYAGSSAEGTPFVLGSDGAGANGEWIDLNAYYSLKSHTHTSAPALDYRTTAPTSNNTTGKLKVAVLSSEPSTKYSGWLYIITG